MAALVIGLRKQVGRQTFIVRVIAKTIEQIVVGAAATTRIVVRGSVLFVHF